jgi:NAD-dependent DNA ligase
MTGFRDTKILEALKNVGAKLGSSVSKNTFVVLVKDLDEDTGKTFDAKKLGIPLMTPSQFVEKYFSTL